MSKIKTYPLANEQNMPAYHGGKNPNAFNQGGAEDKGDKDACVNIRKMRDNGIQDAYLGAIVAFNLVGKKKVEGQNGEGNFDADA